MLDRSKLEMLFKAAERTRLFPLIVLAAATGCRRGELLALTWSDIDFSTGVISVSKSLEETDAGLRLKSTKSGTEALRRTRISAEGSARAPLATGA